MPSRYMTGAVFTGRRRPLSVESGRLVTGHITLADIDDALDAMRARDGARRVMTFERLA